MAIALSALHACLSHAEQALGAPSGQVFFAPPRSFLPKAGCRHGLGERRIGSLQCVPNAMPSRRSALPVDKGFPLSGQHDPTNSSIGPHEHRGWYSRGYLPHFDHPGILQFVTYHLADSLPTQALRRMEAELEGLPPGDRKIERMKRIEKLLDAGHGSCVLREDSAAQCVVENWKHFGGKRYDLIAWVVMPNHVHLLIRVYDGHKIGTIVQSWKSYTGKKIKSLEAETSMGSESALWMRDYWDRFIRDEAHFRNTIRYIHNNPVKARLARGPLDWKWSSAGEFERESAEDRRRENL